jgi:hypothetical protein
VVASAAVLLTLSTGHTIGLGASALVFVVFSLVVAVALPRRQPGFPGRALPALIVATAVLFVGMLAAVEIFGVEKSEPKNEAAAASSQTSP